tara:strand:- start:427 stop:1080 length:654 start_codon:yes stop_codon:yes gene_type:complete
MIKKVKASLSERILLIFLILLGVFSFSFFFITKNKCFFVKKIDLEKIQFRNSENIAVMNVDCGNVVIELFPDLSPNSVKRFKNLIEKGSYDSSAFYRVLKDTLIQAGDLEYGNINNINYFKVGSGKSGLGNLKSELNKEFEFKTGTVAFARNNKLNTEDSEFFIILKDIPLFNGEFTPIGKVIYGMKALKKIKSADKSEYVLRPDFINNFKLLEQNN